MIRYDLVCAEGHLFDAWFSDSASYEEQAAAGLVACPVCGSTRVEKQLMAPAVAGARDADRIAVSEETAKLRAMVRAVHEYVRREAEYVGPRFPEEARRRAEKDDAKPIWGEASGEDVRALREEGIEVMPLPPLPEKKN
jgi:hypothetical protein